MSKTVNLSTYIFTRLRQLGVGSVHGVPGDYTLRALDHLKPAGLRWIGSCNELNAGYAADGYARVKGISALFTTYGVGELSALNAVAGSYAEYAPVVHIVGTAARRAYKSNAMVHHSLGDGRLRLYADIYKNFTVAQAELTDIRTAPELVDSALEQCKVQSRPVYLELPSDMVGAQVSASRLETPLNTTAPSNPSEQENKAVDAVLGRLYSSKRPYILVDGLVAPDGVQDEVNEFARISGIPTFALTFGGGIIDGHLANYHGVHAAQFGTIDFTSYTDSSDLALLFGPLLSDTNTQGWSAVPRKEITIAFRRNTLEMGPKSYDLQVKSVMKTLLRRFDKSKFHDPCPAAQQLGSLRQLKDELPTVHRHAPIEQDTFYLRMSEFFRPRDIILCANGTPLVGGRDFVLPPGAKLINSAIWLSVGHMLPAAQGIALVQRELEEAGQPYGRTIFFEGDGSFQATAQELSTIIRYELDAIIFIINNNGYTFERLIHGIDAEYNDVAPWDYPALPGAFGAKFKSNTEERKGTYSVRSWTIKTWFDLERIIKSPLFKNNKGLKLIDVRMAKDDVPHRFKPALKLAGEQLMADPEK